MSETVTSTMAVQPPTMRATRTERLLATLSVLMLVGAAVSLSVQFLPAPTWWIERFGDPAVTLAANVSLPTDAAALEMASPIPLRLGISDARQVVEGALGQPASLAPTTGTADVAWSTPRGVFGWPAGSDWAFFHAAAPTSLTPRFTTAVARQAEWRRILDSLGWWPSVAAGRALDAEVTEAETPDGYLERATLVPTGFQPDVVTDKSWPQAKFTTDGRLVFFSVGLQAHDALRAVLPESAAMAFDDLRHHRDGTKLVTTKPVSSARLVAQQVQLQWQFLDDEGAVVGTADAETRPQ